MVVDDILVLTKTRLFARAMFSLGIPSFFGIDARLNLGDANNSYTSPFPTLEKKPVLGFCPLFHASEREGIHNEIVFGLVWFSPQF